ncbi:hypothetical protein OG948_54625 (plasmid) [Embleya sp. NBC_00888]|uniref:hypothetical protein n=1 Tax=Embleya sp. NBC_00888 TaxID=2975960 RepID=UPI002F912803|nr:hypothetical protein OG948_54625 [Embleya sp. NBC_00888]
MFTRRTRPGVVGIDDPAVAADIAAAVDFAVVGPDAEAAARTFDRQPGVMVYDIPGSGVVRLRASFEEHCRSGGWDARLEALPARESHVRRVGRVVADGGGSFLAHGVPVVAVGGLPRDRRLPVVASRVDAGDEAQDGWARMTVRISDAPVVSTRPLGLIGVDWARVLFGDVDALGAWQHDDPVDGLADVAFWGADADRAAAEFHAPALGTPGEDHARGWTDLALPDAIDKARALLDWKQDTGCGLAVDFRPHSHHWQVMRQVRASDVEAGTVEVDGARILCAMTSRGDGFFPLFLDLDVTGAPVAVRIDFVASPGDFDAGDSLHP